MTVKSKRSRKARLAKRKKMISHYEKHQERVAVEQEARREIIRVKSGPATEETRYYKGEPDIKGRAGSGNEYADNIVTMQSIDVGDMNSASAVSYTHLTLPTKA